MAICRPAETPAKDFVLRRLALLAAGHAQHTPSQHLPDTMPPSDVLFLEPVTSKLHNPPLSPFPRPDPAGASYPPFPSSCCAVFRLALIRRAISDSRYFRKFSGTTPGAASSRRSATVSSGRNASIAASGAAGCRTSASRTL